MRVVPSTFIALFRRFAGVVENETLDFSPLALFGRTNVDASGRFEHEIQRVDSCESSQKKFSIKFKFAVPPQMAMDSLNAAPWERFEIAAELKREIFTFKKHVEKCT